MLSEFFTTPQIAVCTETAVSVKIHFNSLAKTSEIVDNGGGATRAGERAGAVIRNKSAAKSHGAAATMPLVWSPSVASLVMLIISVVVFAFIRIDSYVASFSEMRCAIIAVSSPLPGWSLL